mmetsp:Transcript_72632/g.126044  ORF Transcript_72632/g.126044 Transcript_72632/m.126044 type:complete len:105 (-) Transcript_72632:1159-1473(-)
MDQNCQQALLAGPVPPLPQVSFSNSLSESMVSLTAFTTSSSFAAAFAALVFVPLQSSVPGGGGGGAIFVVTVVVGGIIVVVVDVTPEKPVPISVTFAQMYSGVQ